MNCFHCGLPVNQDTTLNVNILGTDRAMCCIGCQAIATTIVDIGMANYYTHRAPPAGESSPGSALVPEFLQRLEQWDNEQIAIRYTRKVSTHSRQITLMVHGITCTACVWLIEKHLEKKTGIHKVNIGFNSQRAEVVWDADIIQLSDILKAIAHIGYQAEPYSPYKQEQAIKSDNKKALARIGVASLGTMQVMLLSLGLYFGVFHGITDSHQQLLRWVCAIVTTPVYIYAGYPFLHGAWRNLKARQAGMDIPVAIAISGAFFSSLWATLTHGAEVYFDSVCMFVLFLSLGRYLEMRVRHQSLSASLQQANSGILMARLYNDEYKGINSGPTKNRHKNDRQRNDGNDLTPADQLKPGDIVMIKPGETIPGDGLLIQGSSSVNQAMLTGEQQPCPKSKGLSVIGGTINIEQPIVVEITTEPKNSVLYTLQRLLDRAQTEKPSLNKMADQVAGYFVVTVLALATAIYCYWWQVSPDKAFWCTLAVLVVTCPCALSLATPMTISSATSVLANNGFLATNSNLIETLKNIRHVVFDKTGTLTQGEFAITQLTPLTSLSQQECLALACAMERHSPHPIARAFKAAIKASHDGGSPLPRLKGINVAHNQGIEATHQGQTYRLGKVSYAQQLAKEELTPPTDEGQWLLLSTTNRALAWFRVEDQLRLGAKNLIDYLKGRGISVHMLTGDSSNHASKLAITLGIEKIASGMSPQQKVAYVQALQKHSKVLMVGDGLNDSPVLAASDSAIVMPQGSDLAKISADGVLMKDNIGELIGVFKIVDDTYRIIKQNIGWAIIYNALALPAAAMGLVPPWLAAIGMSCSSLIVVLNALRIRYRPHTAPAESEDMLPVNPALI